MGNKIILVGAGCSGKDHLRHKLQNKGYNYSISYTTRPPRENETDGIDYWFVNDEYFKNLIDNDGLLEYDCFNGWYYGSAKDAWEKYDLFILTPPGVAKLSTEQRKESTIIYLNVEAVVRERRLSKRRDADLVTRRLLADYEMFKGFTEYDILIRNEDF
jgi:guanylate kinase